MISKPTGIRDCLALDGTEQELAVMRPERAANVSVRRNGVRVIAEGTFTLDECTELVSMLQAACRQYHEFTTTQGSPEPHACTST